MGDAEMAREELEAELTPLAVAGGPRVSERRVPPGRNVGYGWL